ncbi:EMYY motif lipoprotein, partial [Staphylococcus aureus]
MPAFEAYEKEAKKLPADNQDAKDLKAKYVDNVKQ